MVNEDSSQIAEQESWNSKSKYEQTYRGVGTSCILVDFESKDKIQGVETNLRSDLGKPKFEEIFVMNYIGKEFFNFSLLKALSLSPLNGLLIRSQFQPQTQLDL
ncbi:MAG: hypothetical protein A3F35_03285 [Candidatus Woykebacteria bacterium RIFCSPHIGHO2_12_FULL_45_10]|uniref:Uncharacterized protein n=1 Tax=Candidatus Woykebacteria bacterium RIFCSPHIGHO2_12_FULL_45_10 TaxID=1802603 RepID=A0A1G1WQR9_9BACT|nr:MAG: hypothetical protein A3F35_03285 [Candidatus Woykebacteria bacterium RIFCSPHIGHO2_12_FULL_45_10]